MVNHQQIEKTIWWWWKGKLVVVISKWIKICWWWSSATKKNLLVVKKGELLVVISNWEKPAGGGKSKLVGEHQQLVDGEKVNCWWSPVTEKKSTGGGHQLDMVKSVVVVNTFVDDPQTILLAPTNYFFLTNRIICVHQWTLFSWPINFFESINLSFFARNWWEIGKKLLMDLY